MQTEYVLMGKYRSDTGKYLWYLSTAIIFKVYIWPKI